MNFNLKKMLMNLRMPLLIIAILIFALSVLYFSWISSPRFGLHNMVPKWISSWTDKRAYENIRTAVPLFFLGGVSGIWLVIKKADKKWWMGVWGCTVVLVLLAEIGQLFMPLRTFDWFDVLWGAIGSGASLLILYGFKCLKSKFVYE